MKILIVEDEFISQILLSEILAVYGSCQIAANGKEALELFEAALEADDPFDLVCLDIMIPILNGQEVLKEIRRLEGSREGQSGEASKVVMTTALDDAKNIEEACAEGLCEAYLVKPIDKNKLVAKMTELGLIAPVSG